MGHPELIPLGFGALFLVTSILFWWRDRVRRATVKRFLKNGAPLIDVGPPAEFQKGHTAGSKNIPREAFGTRNAELGPAGQPVVVCGEGWMTRLLATRDLRAMGYDVVNAGWTTFSMADAAGRPSPR